MSRKSIPQAMVIVACLFGIATADAAGPKAPSRTAPDGPIGTGPDAWDANRDGVYTCEEWKSYLDRWFAAADRNRDGRLDRTEFATLRRPNTFFADADFDYFDENQDGKITHEEFVGKPNEFILQNDKNGDCRVTPEEMKGGGETPKEPGRGGGGKMR